MRSEARSKRDWVLEALALAALLAGFAIAAFYWDRIPRPFRLRPPRALRLWDPRASLLLLLAINTLTYVILTLAARYQRMLSLPAVIDLGLPEVRRIVRSMTIMLKTTTMLLFTYFTWAMSLLASGRGHGLHPAWLAFFVLAIPLPLASYTVKLLRYRK